MRLFYFLLYIILFLLISCNNYNNETIRLNIILSKCNKNIPQKPHLFFVRSNFYCNGCVQSLYFQLEKKIINNNKLNITIIAKDKKYLSEFLLLKVEFLVDTLDIADKVFPKYSNITIFKTNKGKVVNFKNIGDSQDLILPNFILELIN